MTAVNAVVLVDKILQHGLSPLPLCLSSCWGDAGIEDEWEFIPAGIASRGEIVLPVGLRQSRQRWQTISAQVGQRHNRLSGATKGDKGLLSHNGEPVAGERLLHGKHIESQSVDVVEATLKGHVFPTPGSLDNFPTFFEA